MSPRRSRRRPAEMPSRPRRGGRRPASPGTAPAAGPGTGPERAIRLGPPVRQEWPDGDWVVRQVPSAAAAKTYRCPGCDQEIPPGTAHVVAWPEQAGEAEGRRHWHNSCWQRRPRRPGPPFFR